MGATFTCRVWIRRDLGVLALALLCVPFLLLDLFNEAYLQAGIIVLGLVLLGGWWIWNKIVWRRRSITVEENSIRLHWNRKPIVIPADQVQYLGRQSRSRWLLGTDGWIEIHRLVEGVLKLDHELKLIGVRAEKPAAPRLATEEEITTFLENIDPRLLRTVIILVVIILSLLTTIETLIAVAVDQMLGPVLDLVVILVTLGVAVTIILISSGRNRSRARGEARVFDLPEKEWRAYLETPGFQGRFRMDDLPGISYALDTTHTLVITPRRLSSWPMSEE